MGEVLNPDGDIPHFLKKNSGGSGNEEPGVNMIEAYLREVFLGSELKDQTRIAEEKEREAARLAQLTSGLQIQVDETSDYANFLLAVNKGFSAELRDAYTQLGKVPQQLRMAWNRGYLVRVKEEASNRIKIREAQRENSIGRRAVNLIRGKVVSLTSTVSQFLKSAPINR